MKLSKLQELLSFSQPQGNTAANFGPIQRPSANRATHLRSSSSNSIATGASNTTDELSPIFPNGTDLSLEIIGRFADTRLGAPSSSVPQGRLGNAINASTSMSKTSYGVDILEAVSTFHEEPGRHSYEARGHCSRMPSSDHMSLGTSNIGHSTNGSSAVGIPLYSGISHRVAKDYPTTFFPSNRFAGWNETASPMTNVHNLTLDLLNGLNQVNSLEELEAKQPATQEVQRYTSSLNARAQIFTGTIDHRAPLGISYNQVSNFNLGGHTPAVLSNGTIAHREPFGPPTRCTTPSAEKHGRNMAVSSHSSTLFEPARKLTGAVPELTEVRVQDPASFGYGNSSSNYRGDKGDKYHQNMATQPSDSCSVFIKTIPPQATLRDIFDTINEGRVWSMRRTPPNRGFANAIATVNFMNHQAAEAYISKSNFYGVFICGRRCRVIWNVNTHAAAQGSELEQSRVLYITGLADQLCLHQTIDFLHTKIDFELVSASQRMENAYTKTIEIEFCSIIGQSRAAQLCLTRHYRASGIDHTVIFGRDPCSPEQYILPGVSGPRNSRRARSGYSRAPATVLEDSLKNYIATHESSTLTWQATAYLTDTSTAYQIVQPTGDLTLSCSNGTEFPVGQNCDPFTCN
ncbi:hypothetical protein BJ875DRAFT_523797 [Amylocarpus encephaloides]|uniref:RRM domain-containing protein n=1 Tax=Amylocarpus encephaloides TaxID=45428 RepID=A0A9P8C0K2_9HELO|nr:hypothetical protein BJ875DRAFT_523797 [Amylocarpus encephaloides]